LQIKGKEEAFFPTPGIAEKAGRKGQIGNMYMGACLCMYKYMGIPFRFNFFHFK
jgi:hypothetical protein